MKPEWKGPVRLAAALFVLYLAVHYWSELSGLLLVALEAAFPLAVGAAAAYAVNILMSQYERWYFPRSQSRAVLRTRRPVCLLLAYASLAAIVVLLVRMILPELISCVGLLIQKVIPLIDELSLLIGENLTQEQLSGLSDLFLADGSIDWKETVAAAADWLINGLGGVMGSVISMVSATVSSAFTAIMAFIFSIYLLLGKEKLTRNVAQVARTYLDAKWYGRLTYFWDTLNGCFHNFIVGQCTEAVILGLLCMAGMTLFRFPYASMIGALIGFTALIPVAGAYIGAGVGAFMIFTVSPLKALLFLVFIAVLQQLEGNLIYPKVVGSSIGLPGIWVLAAVTVGGGVLGIFGMLLAVPLTATAYQMLRADVVRRSAPAAPAPPSDGEDGPGAPPA